MAEEGRHMKKKVLIAVPYVQYDVYEIEVEGNLEDDQILDGFSDMRAEGDAPDPVTYNVKCLEDYMDETGATYPFLIEEKDLIELTRVVA